MHRITNTSLPTISGPDIARHETWYTPNANPIIANGIAKIVCENRIRLR